jgi:transcription termination factor NusB
MATSLRHKSREFALQMLFEWDMTHQEPAGVEQNFWKSARAAD